MALTKKEWAEQPTGTRAYMVKTYNGNTGNCVDIEYVLKTGDDDETDDLNDARCVASGYFTDTFNVKKS